MFCWVIKEQFLLICKVLWQMFRSAVCRPVRVCDWPYATNVTTNMGTLIATFENPALT